MPSMSWYQEATARVDEAYSSMDRYQEVMSRFARSTAELQLAEVERSIGTLVRREVDALMNGLDSSDDDDGKGGGSPGTSRGTQDSLFDVGLLSCADPSMHSGMRSCRARSSETIWDAALLLGLPAVGSVGSLLIACSFLFSVLMQATIYIALSKGFSRDASVVKVQAYQWQQLLEMLELEGAGVAAGGAAAGTEGVAVSSNITATLQQHLPTLVTFQLLCVVAMMVWMLSVAREIGHALASAVGVCSLPRHGTVTVRALDTDVLVSVGVRRLGFAGLVATLRLTIVAGLLSAGMRRLATSRSPIELALNSAALAFALDVPRRVRAWSSKAIIPLQVRVQLTSLETLAPLFSTARVRAAAADSN